MQCRPPVPLAADISSTACHKILTMTLDRSAIKGVIQRCDIMASAGVPASLWRSPRQLAYFSQTSYPRYSHVFLCPLPSAHDLPIREIQVNSQNCLTALHPRKIRKDQQIAHTFVHLSLRLGQKYLNTVNSLFILIQMF